MVTKPILTRASRRPLPTASSRVWRPAGGAVTNASSPVATSFLSISQRARCAFSSARGSVAAPWSRIGFPVTSVSPSRGVRIATYWRSWLAANLDYARRPQSEHGLGLIDIEPETEGLILIGRDESVPDSTRALRRLSRKQITPKSGHSTGCGARRRDGWTSSRDTAVSPLHSRSGPRLGLRRRRPRAPTWSEFLHGSCTSADSECPQAADRRGHAMGVTGIEPVTSRV
jgi:hypothetical protein